MERQLQWVAVGLSGNPPLPKRRAPETPPGLSHKKRESGRLRRSQPVGRVTSRGGWLLLPHAAGVAHGGGRGKELDRTTISHFPQLTSNFGAAREEGPARNVGAMAGLLGKMERIREALGLHPAPIPTLIAQANAHLELSLHGGYMHQADLILHALFGGTGVMATSPNKPAAAQSVTAQLSGLDLSGRASTPPSPVPVEPPHRVETPPYHLNGAGDDAEAAELKGATDSVSVQPEPEPTPETVQTPPHDLPGVPFAPSDLEQPSPAYSTGSSTRSDSSAGCLNSAEQKEPRSRIDGRRREPDDSDGSATPPRSQSPSKQEEPHWGVA
eukprot:scaffold6267_cov106-Isochrysis_galbana.AAC.1